MSTLLTPAASGADISPGRSAARLVKATKTYGSGEAAVAAIDGVDIDFGAGKFTVSARFSPSSVAVFPTMRSQLS